MFPDLHDRIGLAVFIDFCRHYHVTIATYDNTHTFWSYIDKGLAFFYSDQRRLDSYIGSLAYTKVFQVRIHTAQKIIAVTGTTPAEIKVEVVILGIAVTDKGMTILKTCSWTRIAIHQNRTTCIKLLSHQVFVSFTIY